MQQLGNTCTAQDCKQADWAGCVLRMAGHDFMDFAGGVGGADACTNMQEADNAGLKQCLSEGEFGFSLKDLYSGFCHKVSLADFLVVSAEAVMAITRERWTNQVPSASPLNLKSQFRFGRTTADADCREKVSPLPNPEGGCREVERVFVQNLGLSWTSAVALMGVHTLGRARPENSGYDGWWSDPESSRLFNNNYYVSILTKGWVPENLRPGKNQFRRSDSGTTVAKEMMLSTDLCFAYTEGEGEVPINAAQHSCCAWADSFVVGGKDDGQHVGAVANNGGMFCGVNCATDANTNPIGQPAGQGCNGGLDERRLCCGGVNDDCGDPQRPNGVGIQATMDFASSDSKWLSEFASAWKQVTELGVAARLKPLGQC